MIGSFKMVSLVAQLTSIMLPGLQELVVGTHRGPYLLVRIIRN